MICQKQYFCNKDYLQTQNILLHFIKAKFFISLILAGLITDRLTFATKYHNFN